MGDLEDVPDLVDSGEESDEWIESDDSNEQTICLFCPKLFHTIAVALDHCRTEHSFDLLELKSRYNMDCYSYIKMVNYIRKEKPQPEDIVLSSTILWSDEIYLKPVEMESWLMYDFDDLGSAPSTPHYGIDGKPPIGGRIEDDLALLRKRLNEQEEQLQEAKKTILKMKQVTQSIVQAEDTSEKPQTPSSESLDNDENSDYFQSYSHFGIHHEMLDDKVRTESYRDAILKNCDTFKNKIVLDVGCGTGILSMFSAKAGASKVYGIDQSEVVYKAMDIVRENNLHETVHLIKGRVEETNLPVDKVDIIISEWMGYFLLFEGMLDSFIFARDKFLKSEGTILPNRCNINLVAVSDLDKYNNLITFWDNVYDFKMSTMKQEVLKEAFIETIPLEKIISTPATLIDINLMTCDINTCEFSSKFVLNCLNDGVITALAGYFDTFFELPNEVNFSTGPQSTRTHWQQTVFYLKDVINVKKGDTIEGTLSCTRLRKNVRGLGITISIKDKKYKYIID